MAAKIHILDLTFLGHSDTIAAFLVEQNGDLALVETGPHSTFLVLKEAIKRLGFDILAIKHVFLSHIHFDHAGAAWALAQNGATVYVHPVGEKHLIAPEKLYNSAKQIYQDKMEMLWGEMHGIAPQNLKTPQHGETVLVGKLEFKAWHTPGHAHHHIAWQLGNNLFTGDVAGCKIGGGIVVPPCPPPDIDLELWQNSIALMRNLGVKKLYLTHFGVFGQVKKHLDALENRLLRWANWVKKHQELGKTAEEIVPLYQEFTRKELARFGITGEKYAQYESANPAFMSVAGLMRYWQKKAAK